VLARIWQKARVALDRPRRRWLLVVPGSLWVTAKERAPCLTYWHDGEWVHRYRGARIPHAGLGRAAPPAVFTAQARDLFLHEYEPGAGDVVFDVGAGIGAETLVFSRLVGATGRVVAIEAHPRTFARLQRLVEANRLANVTTLQVAVSDADGTTEISDSGTHVRNTTGAGDIRIPARRIDTLAQELGIDQIDLLKMNVEGAERSALPGAGELLERTRHAVISCHDFLADDGGDDALRTKHFVRDFLRNRGFAVTTRDDAPDPWTRDYVYGSSTA
jgi:FkbM family methyltransferase